MTYLSLSSLSLSLQGLGVWSLDHIPRGTRFGPLVGEVFSREPYSRKETDRISLWKVKYFFIKILFVVISHDLSFFYLCLIENYLIPMILDFVEI